MENVILTIHLILALLLIGVVLLQRSEGGGLGMGGGGGAISARGAANALTKLTWIFAIGFIITSLTLTILAARSADSSSLPPPTADAPVPPPRADAPAEGTPAAPEQPATQTAPSTPAPAPNN
jgi:preprotein translocase subunit SecG